MKTIAIRKAGAIRLTSAASPLYGPTCTSGVGGIDGSPSGPRLAP